MANKIEDIVSYTEFRPPNKRVEMQEIHYVTPKGYRGIVRLEKAGSTVKSISAAVDADALIPDSLIGTTTVNVK